MQTFTGQFYVNENTLALGSQILFRTNSKIFGHIIPNFFLMN